MKEEVEIAGNPKKFSVGHEVFNLEVGETDSIVKVEEGKEAIFSLKITQGSVAVVLGNEPFIDNIGTRLEPTVLDRPGVYSVRARETGKETKGHYVVLRKLV